MPKRAADEKPANGADCTVLVRSPSSEGARARSLPEAVRAGRLFQLVCQICLEAKFRVGGILHHDRNGALDLVVDLRVQRLARRGVVGDLRGGAAADRLIDELGAMRS